MNLMLGEISTAVGGECSGAADVSVQGYSIDSRTIRPAELFFAIKGPRFDGHQFVEMAREKGAAGAVVEEGNFQAGPGFGIIRVRSVLDALQTLAHHVRRAWGGTVVGVTGSVGKTTTREMTARVLSEKFRVLKTAGNLNNEYGLPVSLLRVEPAHEIAVLEMGMSASGEILKLASIAEPNAGVITNVNPVHLEFFDSVDAIARAKAELLQGLVEPRMAFLNFDDSRVRAMAEGFSGTVVSYAVQAPADFRIENFHDLGLAGTAFHVRHEGLSHEFVLPLPGQHNVINACAAIAVGVSHGVGWDEVRTALSDMKPEKMRGEIVRFSHGFSVIDDSYNSNPRALTEMIRFCGKLRDVTRKIVVAGEMLELGTEAVSLHRECGREAAGAGIDILIGVQGTAQEILAGAREAGFPENNLIFAADASEAGRELVARVRPGDVVLIKGSRGVKLEKALDALRTAFPGAES